MSGSPRLSYADWLDAGLGLLAREGPAGLRIDRLCAATGRTRGSFYHHFRDQAAYMAALLAHWEERHTDAVMALAAKAGGTPRDRRNALTRIAATLDPRIELAVRSWAGVSDAARETLERVDRRRLDYRAGLNQAEFGLGAAAARQLAELEYAAYVGFQMLFPDASEVRQRAIVRRLDTLLGLAAGGQPPPPSPGI